MADPLGHATAYGFDLLGRVTSVTDPLNKATTLGYDASDNLLWVQDAAANKTQYAYDKLDRVTTVTDPRGKNTAYAYDDAGRLLTVTDRLGRVRQFGYDDAGRRTGETWKTSGGVTVQTQGFGYDAAANLTSVADTQTNSGYTLVYDKLNRAETVTGPFGITLTFGYDANGNRTSAADNKGATQASVYDRLDRLTRRTLDTAAGDARADYTYTAAGGVDVVTRYADLAGTTKVGTTDYDYDVLNRATAITHRNGAGTTLAAYGYGWDAADRLTSKTEGGSTTTYAYDDADQLTADGSKAYTYDATGNRTNAGYTTGTGNRLSSDGTWTYTYDDAGQLVKKSKGSAAETWTYAYDHDGRLTGATKSNTDGGAVVAGVAYAYDAFGNRLSRTETGAGGATVAAERFAYDGWDTAKPDPVGTEQFDVWADLDTANAVTNRRLWGAGFDEATARVTAGGAVTWYTADLTGSVRHTLNAAGAVTHTAAYDAFGALTSGSLADRYGYAGREREGVDGSYHNRDRVYRPDAGRFTSEDPAGLAPDVNPYRYVHNRPTTHTDPSGRWLVVRDGDEGPWLEKLREYGLEVEYVVNRTETWIASTPRGVIIVKNPERLTALRLNAEPGWEQVVFAALDWRGGPTGGVNLMGEKDLSVNHWAMDGSDNDAARAAHWKRQEDRNYRNPEVPRYNNTGDLDDRVGDVFGRMRGGSGYNQPYGTANGEDFGVAKGQAAGLVFGMLAQVGRTALITAVETYAPGKFVQFVAHLRAKGWKVVYGQGGRIKDVVDRNGRRVTQEALDDAGREFRDAAKCGPAKSFAEQAGIPKQIDLTKPNNVWGQDGRNLQSYFRRQGFDSKMAPPKSGTSGKAQVFKPENHPTIAEVQYHPGGGIHGGSYYKFTMKDGSKVKIIDPNNYVMRGGVESRTTYFNPQGQRIEFNKGKWTVVPGS